MIRGASHALRGDPDAGAAIDAIGERVAALLERARAAGRSPWRQAVEEAEAGGARTG